MMAEGVTVRGGITQASLELMQGLVSSWSKHATIVQMARMIADDAHALNPVAEAQAVWRWVRVHVTYRADPVDTQWVQDPWETLVVTKAGNCANMAVAVGALLQALGHPCEMMAVQWTDRPTYTHAVCFDHKINAVVDSVSPSFQWPPAGRSVLRMMGAL